MVFLCASPWERIYPMEREDDFEPAHVVAAANDRRLDSADLPAPPRRRCCRS